VNTSTSAVWVSVLRGAQQPFRSFGELADDVRRRLDLLHGTHRLPGVVAMASILPVLQRVGGGVMKRVKGSVAPASPLPAGRSPPTRSSVNAWERPHYRFGGMNLASGGWHLGWGEDRNLMLGSPLFYRGWGKVLTS
jgi:hypothetical protein